MSAATTLAPAAAVEPRRISARDHVYGEPDGLIQVVIYGDLASGRTAQAYRAVHDAAYLYGCLRATLRYRLPEGDDGARASAAAAEAVVPFGLYWPFVDQVLRTGADPASLRRACRALDIDEDVIDADVALPRSAARIAEDHRLAEEARVSTTPAVFVNGVRWRAHPYAGLLADLCRLAELTRPLWAGTERHDRRPR